MVLADKGQFYRLKVATPAKHSSSQEKKVVKNLRLNISQMVKTWMRY